MLSSKTTAKHACCIIVDADITFENGAIVRCGFLTNLEPDYVLKVEPELARRLKEVCTKLAKQGKRKIPKYEYPDYVQTTALAMKYAKYGIDYAIRKEDAIFIRGLDAQREYKKEIFGHGLLLSERAAAERAAAHVWKLSEREQRLVEMLTKHG